MHAQLGQVNEGFLLFLMAKGLVKPKKFSLNPLFQEYEMLDHYDLLYLDMTISDGSSATKDIVIVQNASDYLRYNMLKRKPEPTETMALNSIDGDG